MRRLPFLLLISGLIFGCAAGDESSTKEFVIVDQESNKILNSYEYSNDSGDLVRTSSYDQKQQVSRGIEYEYDAEGNLVKTVETVPGSSPKTITYETEREYDAAGRIVKMTRTSSEGEIIETNFGYDDTGTLRGVVEQVDKNTVLMQDY